MTDIRHLLTILLEHHTLTESEATAVLAEATDMGAAEIDGGLHKLRELGLILTADADLPIHATEAGRQYAGGVTISDDALRFLPETVDDLYARAALLDATQALVREFNFELVEGRGAAFAAALLPDAFALTIDELLAGRLYAAMTAVAVRLAQGLPAACVAEELMAVAFVVEAEASLEAAVEDARLSEGQAANAVDTLRGVFEVFGDDDVLALFDMVDPSDAAVAGHDDLSQQLGIVDLRPESWFAPFGGEIGAGHLDSTT